MNTNMVEILDSMTERLQISIRRQEKQMFSLLLDLAELRGVLGTQKSALGDENPGRCDEQKEQRDESQR